MALQKTFNTIYGVDANHWVIETININNKFKYAEIQLLGYVSEQCYIDGKSPIENIKIKVNHKDGFDAVFGKQSLRNRVATDIYAIAYDYVKNYTKDFNGAIDK